MVRIPVIPSASPRGATRVVRIGDSPIGGGSVCVIGGPCAVEDGYVDHAVAAAAAGASVLRGCVFKPRTRPDTFQGLGPRGLSLLDEAREVTGRPILAEPLERADVAILAAHEQALLIGTRSMQNTALLQEAAVSGLPIVLKRAMSATYDECLSAADCIEREGNHQVILCERGIRTFETATRNTLDLSAVAVLRERTNLPIAVDPSHAGGRAAWVAPLALAAVAAGTLAAVARMLTLT